MTAYASAGGFHAQACYHCSQAAEKALKAWLLALDQEPERTHSIERRLRWICSMNGMGTWPWRWRVPWWASRISSLRSAMRHNPRDAPHPGCRGWSYGRQEGAHP